MPAPTPLPLRPRHSAVRVSADPRPHDTAWPEMSWPVPAGTELIGDAIHPPQRRRACRRGGGRDDLVEVRRRLAQRIQRATA